MDLLRKYRIQFDKSPYINDQSYGISIIDFAGTFIIAWILDKYLNLSTRLNISTELYYASLLPISVVSHILIGQTTYLNTKFLGSEINIYRILFVVYVAWYSSLIFNN